MGKKSKVTVLPCGEDMKKGGVYRIYNSINSFSYIGSTVNFSNRLAGHIHDCKRGKGNRNLTEFIKLHGAENLTFDIIEIIEDMADLITRENFWMSKYKFENLWNSAPDAGSLTGVKMPNSQKQATRKRMMGNTLTKGVSPKKETLEKISNFWKNNPERLQEMKDNNRESQKRVNRKEWLKGNIIEVFFNGELIDTVDGLKEVEIKHNLSHVTASKLATGKKKDFKGFSLQKIGTFFITDKVHKRVYDSGQIIIIDL